MSLSFGIINKRSLCKNEDLNNENIVRESVIKSNLSNLDRQIHHDLTLQEASNNKGKINHLSYNKSSISPVLEKYYNQFIANINNSVNADLFINEAIYLISEINNLNREYANKITTDIISDIIPKVSINELNRIQYKLNENFYGHLTESQLDKLNTCIKNNIVADRILENHNRLSKRFNIENEIASIRSKGLERTIESVCDILDTYKIEPYQKLNICIEEMTYILSKNGIKYDKSKLVREALEDIILVNELDLHTLKGYNKALKESYILEQDDISQVSNIISNDICNKDNINSYIDGFMINPNKDYTSLIALSIKIAKESSLIDIYNNIDKLIFLLRKCCVMNIINEEDAKSCLDGFVDTIVNREDINEDCINRIISKIYNCCQDNRFCAKYSIPDNQYKSDYIKDYCENSIIPMLQSDKTMYYDKYNLEAMQYFANESTIMTINEFKRLRLSNLIIAARNFNNLLKVKRRKKALENKGKLIRAIAKARNVLFGENASIENIENHIGSILTENNIPDICVCIYEYNDSSEEELKNFLLEACKEYNDTLAINSNNDIRAYYIMNCNCAEVHIRENIQIIDEDSTIERELSFEENYYINEFSETIELMNRISSNNIPDINSFILEFNKRGLDKEAFEVALEAMSILGISEQEVNAFKAMVDIEGIDEINYEPIDQNMIISELDRLVAYDALSSILEVAPKMEKPKVGAAYWEDDDDDEDDDEEENEKKDKDTKKEDKKETNNDNKPGNNNNESNNDDKSEKTFGTSLNKLKLGLLGIKQKFDTLNQKGKEGARNFDNASRVFTKGLKDAMISDRREAIIKGSIIPSFGKCIKIGIGLAGIAVFTHPIIAIITAIGGFAISKHLTYKERMLLLDDIEVELDVVEKEISLAESRNQMNKYRQLQKYKKELQRQYQRIKYNVRVGKDILPGSTVGLKKFD